MLWRISQSHKHSVWWVITILLSPLSDPGNEKQRATPKIQCYPTHFSWQNTSELTSISPRKEGSQAIAGRDWYPCYFSWPGSVRLLRRIIITHHTLCLWDWEFLCKTYVTLRFFIPYTFWWYMSFFALPLFTWRVFETSAMACKTLFHNFSYTY